MSVLQAGISETSVKKEVRRKQTGEAAAALRLKQDIASQLPSFHFKGFSTLVPAPRTSKLDLSATKVGCLKAQTACCDLGGSQEELH